MIIATLLIRTKGRIVLWKLVQPFLVRRSRVRRKPVNPYRSKTLQELENSDWGEPTYDSYLVSTVHRLRRKPLKEFTIEDLRILIGQNVGLPYLLPLAIERLEENPLAEGDYYPGDLLKSVLIIEESFWRTRLDLRGAVETLLRRAGGLLDQATEEDYEVTKEALKEGAEIFGSVRGGSKQRVEKRNV